MKYQAAEFQVEKFKKFDIYWTVEVDMLKFGVHINCTCVTNFNFIAKTARCQKIANSLKLTEVLTRVEKTFNFPFY